MKREVKAALALGLALLLGLLGVWASGEGKGPPSTGAASPRASGLTQGSLAPAPAAEPSSPQAGSQPGATPGPLGSPSPKDMRRPRAEASPAASPAADAPRFLGQVLAPDGAPVETQVYAFEVTSEASESFPDFGDETPPEVVFAADAVSQGRARFLRAAPADAEGRFAFPREEVQTFELLLVAAAPEGVGVLRLRPGPQPALLSLSPRRPFEVEVLSAGRDLSGARLQLETAPNRYLEFPPFDARGRSRLELPAQRPRAGQLELDQAGWLEQTRSLSAAELAGGQVSWSLPNDLAALRGKVLDPEGVPWREGEVGFLLVTDGGPDLYLAVATDAEGAFLAQGFPPGQSLQIQIAGGKEHAFYLGQATAGGPPLTLRLERASVLEVEVGRFEGDVDALECDWRLQRLEGERWLEVESSLYARIARRFFAEDEETLDRHFGLRIGVNRVLGLPAGRYRVSLAEHEEETAARVQVVLPEAGSARCKLGVRAKPKTTIRARLVSPGADLAKKRVTVRYELEQTRVQQDLFLDVEGRLALEVDLIRAVRARLSLPGLRLGADLTLDPGAPDLGTVVLEED